MDEQLSKNFTTLGFIMTCIIVIFHCGNGNAAPVCEIDRYINDGVMKVCTNMAIVAMSYFFVTSGYLFFVNYSNHVYFTKIRKRIITLLVPYIIWELIFGIKMLSEGGKEAFIAQTFLLEPWPPNGPLWYMYAVFLIMLFSPIIYILLKNRIVGFVTLIAIHVLARAVFGFDSEVIRTITEYGYISNVIYYLPSFFAGAYLGMQRRETTNDSNIRKYVVIVGLTFAVIGFFNYDDINFLQSFMAELISVLLIVLLPDKIDIGKYSVTNVTFMIYVLHNSVDTNITPLIRDLLIKVCRWASFANIFGRIMSLVLVICMAFILSFILNKISPKLLSVITGGRVRVRIKETS